MAKYGLNRVTLIGNLGQDPELRYLDQGIPLVSISLACTERSRSRDGNYVDRTEWFNVNIWRGQAETVSKYCRKGSTLYVEGRLRNQSWETPQGEKRRRLDIDATKVILLDSRPAGMDSMGGGVQAAPQQTSHTQASPQMPSASTFDPMANQSQQSSGTSSKIGRAHV
mgnify:CR=1 FL=1